MLLWVCVCVCVFSLFVIRLLCPRILVRDRWTKYCSRVDIFPPSVYVCVCVRAHAQVNYFNNQTFSVDTMLGTVIKSNAPFSHRRYNNDCIWYCWNDIYIISYRSCNFHVPRWQVSLIFIYTVDKLLLICWNKLFWSTCYFRTHILCILNT